jgi:hypothetical protein
MNWYVWIIIGFAVGYIVKDLITVEKKIDISIGKQKVRGKDNVMDNDYDVNVDQKKQRKRLFKRNKRNNLHVS